MEKLDAIVAGAFNIAYAEAYKRKHTQLTPFHLLWGLLKSPESFCSQKLKNHNTIISQKMDVAPSASQAVPMDRLAPDSKLQEWLTCASGQAAEKGREDVMEADLLRFMPQIFQIWTLTTAIFQLKSKPIMAFQSFYSTSMKGPKTANSIQ